MRPSIIYGRWFSASGGLVGVSVCPPLCMRIPPAHAKMRRLWRRCDTWLRSTRLWLLDDALHCAPRGGPPVERQARLPRVEGDQDESTPQAQASHSSPSQESSHAPENSEHCTAYAFKEWCENHEIEKAYIRPDKPTRNSFVERFNCSYRTKVLNAWMFDSLD